MPSLLDDESRFQPLLIQPPDQDQPDTSWADALAETYRNVSGFMDRARNTSWQDVGDYAKQFVPTRESLERFGGEGLKAWMEHDVVIPEGAQPVMLDTGPGYQLTDGSYVRRDQLPRRSAVLPLSRDESDPKATGGLVVSMPGVPGVLPALGSEGGALVRGAEEGAVLGAGATRRARPRPEAPPEVPPVPAVNERAAIGGNQPPPEARLTMNPEAFQTQMTQRGGLLDEGVPTRSANLGAGREGTMMGVPNLRNIPQDDAIAIASTEPHLIPQRDGGYVGAPSDVRTPQDVSDMRAAFDQAVERGQAGADWYDRSKEWNQRVTGGDPIQQRQLAERLGIGSPQANPETNLGFTVTGHNALARGIPAETVRTGQQALTMNEGAFRQAQAIAAGEPFPNIEQGLKTGPFAQNLDPTAQPGTTGVNDIWHARSFGYKEADGSPWDSALTTQQHVFMDYETMLAVQRANERRLGGRDNWTAAEIQASPWVANKAADLRRRYQTGKPNPWTDAEIWEEANATFPDRAQGITGSVPHEQVPGSVTGLTTGTMSPEEFTNAANWIDPNTRQDVLLAHDLGLLSDQTQIAPGVYVNARGETEFNPSHVGQGLLDLAPLEEGGKPTNRSLHPGMESAMMGSQASRGLLDVQEINPYTMVRTNVPGPNANAVKITLGRQATADEMAQMHQLAKDHDFFASNTADGVALIDQGQGRGGAQVNKMLTKEGLEDKIRSILPGEGVQVQRGANLGNYVDLSKELDKAVAGEGQATRKVFGYLDNMRTQAPAMYDRLMSSPEVQAKAQLNLQRLRDSGQLGVRPDYEELLRLVAGGRLTGLQARIQREGYAGLPAVGGQAGLVSSMLGASGSTPTERERRPW